MSEKYQYEDGIKFTRDDATGYYLNSTLRKRIHRYVWEKHYGSIPDGYEIHHKDFNKSNNNIENLELIKKERHASIHGRENGIANVESGLLDEIRPLTKKWHKSDEGRRWHKKHYEKNKNKLYQEKEFVCDWCGKHYISTINGRNRFCSNRCKSAWRRASGIDDEERECIICGKKYTVNKYSKTKTCSKSCASKYAYRNRKDKKN